MIGNPNKLQEILQINVGLTTHTNTDVEIGNEKIRCTSSVNLLRVHIDDKLNFNEHINGICKFAGNQLNALL